MPRAPKSNKPILVLTSSQKLPRRVRTARQDKNRLIVPNFIAKAGKALSDAAKAAAGLSSTPVHPSRDSPSVPTRTLVCPAPPPSPIISPSSTTRGPLKITLRINTSSSAPANSSSPSSSATSSPIVTPENSPNKRRRIILKTREHAAADILLSLGQRASDDDVEMVDDDVISSAALLLSLGQHRSARSIPEDGEEGEMDVDESDEEDGDESEEEDDDDGESVDISPPPARDPRAGTLSVIEVRGLEDRSGTPSVIIQSPGRTRYRVGKASTTNMPGMSLQAPYIDSYANGDYVTPVLARR